MKSPQCEAHPLVVTVNGMKRDSRLGISSCDCAERVELHGGALVGGDFNVREHACAVSEAVSSVHA